MCTQQKDRSICPSTGEYRDPFAVRGLLSANAGEERGGLFWVVLFLPRLPGLGQAVTELLPPGFQSLRPGGPGRSRLGGGRNACCFRRGRNACCCVSRQRSKRTAAQMSEWERNLRAFSLARQLHRLSFALPAVVTCRVRGGRRMKGSGNAQSAPWKRSERQRKRGNPEATQHCGNAANGGEKGTARRRCCRRVLSQVLELPLHRAQPRLLPLRLAGRDRRRRLRRLRHRKAKAVS